MMRAMDTGKSPNLPKVLSALEQLTEEELVQVNRIIIARLRLMQDIRAHGRMMDFQLGQSVQFTDASGRVLRAVVSRHNRKSVTVVTPDGMQWRVSPSLLRPVDGFEEGSRARP